MSDVLPESPIAPADRAAAAGASKVSSLEKEAGSLLDLTAAIGVAASAIGGIIAPGLKGNASDRVVVVWDIVASFFGFACGLLLVTSGVRASTELSRASRLPIALRGVVLSLAAVVLGLSCFAAIKRLPAAAGLALGAAASVLVLTAGVYALRAAHTRATGIVTALFGITALLRLMTWEIAAYAGAHGFPSTQTGAKAFVISRALGSVAVIVEAAGQLSAAMWLGTRSRIRGQILSTSVVVIAFSCTWAAARGNEPHAPVWQRVLHYALGELQGTPSSELLAVAAFLVVASILFAGASLVQRGQPLIVTASLALALLGRGALDAPLRALPAVVGALWLLLVTHDARAMWESLLKSRESPRQEDENRSS